MARGFHLTKLGLGLNFIQKLLRRLPELVMTRLWFYPFGYAVEKTGRLA